MYKSLVVLLIVATAATALPSFKWRRSARSDAPAPQPNGSRLLDLSFLQNFPRFMFGPMKRSSQPSTDLFSFVPLDGRASRPDTSGASYHSYDVLPSSSNFKPAINKPLASNELSEPLNDVSANEPYEDDDVIVIPFTKHRGTAKFGEKWDNKKYPNTRNEQGVPAPPGPVANSYDTTSARQATNKQHVKNLSKRFESKVITDSEDDLETGDELPASLGTDETGADFKVQFSDLHPVYVKPPKEFQPLIYPNRAVDAAEALRSDSQATVRPLVTDEKQERPYKYPNGLSSWILGGSRPIQRTGFWESLTSDESLHGYRTPAGSKVELELNDNSLERADVESRPTRHAAGRSLLNEQDNLEFISLSEPKSRSDDEKLSKKAYLINKLKPGALSKSVLLKRKLSLKPKRVKILSKANKLFDKSAKLN